MKEKQPNWCKSFKPFVDRRSRVLILGSMPGPEALRRQEYYGFPGNHFWTIVPMLLGKEKPSLYKDKLSLLKKNRIALWDVIASCVRSGALDSNIKNPVPNKIPALLKKYPNIQAVFINGQLAFSLFQKTFKEGVDRPVFRLPSSSPAHASISISEKAKQWGLLLKFLYNAESKIKSKPRKVSS